LANPFLHPSLQSDPGIVEFGAAAHFSQLVIKKTESESDGWRQLGGAARWKKSGWLLAEERPPGGGDIGQYR
jgi:hypothetical protein